MHDPVKNDGSRQSPFATAWEAQDQIDSARKQREQELRVQDISAMFGGVKVIVKHNEEDARKTRQAIATIRSIRQKEQLKFIARKVAPFAFLAIGAFTMPVAATVIGTAGLFLATRCGWNQAKTHKLIDELNQLETYTQTELNWICDQSESKWS